MGTEYTAADAFEDFDTALKLDEDQRDEAIELHNELTELLQEKGLIATAFLQGSFRRKTMLAPLRDVDKVVIVSAELDGLSPDEVMDRLEDVISVAYPDASFDRVRHALQIDFGEATFLFDTVPAKETDTADDDVLIANRETGQWDRSNTRELIRTIATRNGETGDRFIHQVRMVKQVIVHLLDGNIPGLHVESWSYEALTATLPHDEAVTITLESAAQMINGAYTEPTGVDTISNRLRPEVIAAAAPVLANAAARAREAFTLAEAGDHNEAIRIWHGLFGTLFPEPAAQDARSALERSYAGGGVTTSGGVSTVARTTQRSQPARPWRR